MKGEQASRRRGKSQGLAAQRGRGWSDGKLTGKGAVSEAGLVGRRSCWDRGASGWDAVGKHHPEESQGWGEQGPPRLQPLPPTWPLTSSPRCDSLPHPRLRPHPHRLALGGTTQGQQSPGRALASSQPGPPGSQTHPRSRSWPHCWLPREREREINSAQAGLGSARPQPLGPAPRLPPSESCREEGMRWEPPGGCGDRLGVKGQWSCWSGALGQEGLRQAKRPPFQGGEGPQRRIQRGRGYLRDGEQIWLAQGWVGGHRRVGSGWWPGGKCG